MLAGGMGYYYRMRKQRQNPTHSHGNYSKVAASESIPMSNVAPKVAVPVTLKASDVEFSMGNEV